MIIITSSCWKQYEKWIPQTKKKPKVESAPHDGQEPPTPENNTYADAEQTTTTSRNKQYEWAAMLILFE